MSWFFKKVGPHCASRNAKKIALSKTYRKRRRVNEQKGTLKALRVMTRLRHSRELKRNVGQKWVKYIINKNIENSRKMSYRQERSLTHWQQPPKHFELNFFFMRSMTFII